MPDIPNDAVTTVAFGSSGYYAERARDAQDYKATRGRRIHDVELVCSPDRVIRGGGRWTVLAHYKPPRVLPIQMMGAGCGGHGFRNSSSSKSPRTAHCNHSTGFK
jgi:hypothetical protein